MESKPVDRKILGQVGSYIWQKGAFSTGVYRNDMQPLGHTIAGNNGSVEQDRVAPLALKTLQSIEEQLTNELERVRQLRAELAAFLEANKEAK